MFARGGDGSFALSGLAYSNDSKGGAFVAWISPDRQQQRVFRTAPYATRKIAVASDGTIWTIGRELTDGEELNPGHDVVRRFDAEGNLLGSYLPKPSLMRDGSRQHPALLAWLVSARGRVGLHSPLSREYIEFSLDPVVVSRFPGLPLEPGGRLSGLALCDDGGVYASIDRRDKSGVKRWEVASLDRSARAWKPVEIRSGSSALPWMALAGCEGDTPMALTPQFHIGSLVRAR
ncbi:MAG: hypothetical protein FJW37_12535 [Acidobacteria bacterium]|nr:hypothetical protein [Acidobacteriota bacterium]